MLIFVPECVFNVVLMVFSLVVLVIGRLDRWPDDPVTLSAGDIWAIWKWLCVHDAGTQLFLFN